MGKHELLYYDTLKRIARDYQSPEEIRRDCEKRWGLPYAEALEMAYENLQFEAESAIKRKRRPKDVQDGDE